MIKKTITTFGGSQYKLTDSEYLESVELGCYLAQKGYTVKCGGYYGLMEGIAKGVAMQGGICIGVTNASFDPKEANKYITTEIKSADIYDRLRELIKDSHFFIVQHGSLGTLTELFLVWCLLYTEIITERKIFLIGEIWNNFNTNLKKFPLNEEDHNYVRIFNNLSDFKEYFNEIEK